MLPRSRYTTFKFKPRRNQRKIAMRKKRSSRSFGKVPCRLSLQFTSSRLESRRSKKSGGAKGRFGTARNGLWMTECRNERRNHALQAVTGPNCARDFLYSLYYNDLSSQRRLVLRVAVCFTWNSNLSERVARPSSGSDRGGNLLIADTNLRSEKYGPKTVKRSSAPTPTRTDSQGTASRINGRSRA